MPLLKCQFPNCTKLGTKTVEVIYGAGTSQTFTVCYEHYKRLSPKMVWKGKLNDKAIEKKLKDDENVLIEFDTSRKR